MASMRQTLMRMSPAARAAPARAFSEHAPPLKLFGIPARYANATYSAASKAGVLDQVETELGAFKAVLEKKPEFKEYLGNPTVSRDVKVAAIGEMFSAKGKGAKKISTVTQNLMATMAGNNRIGEAGKVADAYSELMKAKRGELDAIVTSSATLTAAQLKKVTDVLKKQAGGKNVSITTKVNPAIMGGLQLQIGDQFLDLSVKSKIQAINASLLSA